MREVGDRLRELRDACYNLVHMGTDAAPLDWTRLAGVRPEQDALERGHDVELTPFDWYWYRFYCQQDSYRSDSPVVQFLGSTILSDAGYKGRESDFTDLETPAPGVWQCEGPRYNYKVDLNSSEITPSGHMSFNMDKDDTNYLAICLDFFANCPSESNLDISSREASTSLATYLASLDAQTEADETS